MRYSVVFRGFVAATNCRCVSLSLLLLLCKNEPSMLTAIVATSPCADSEATRSPLARVVTSVAGICSNGLGLAAAVARERANVRRNNIWWEWFWCVDVLGEKHKRV